MADFNKFQWSIFLNGKDEQVVVRGDDWKQFVLDVEAVKKEFSPEGKSVSIKEEVGEFPDDIPLPEEPDEETEPYWVNEVKKEGPNKGRHFKSGKVSHKFLGWTEEPLTNAR